METEKLKPTYLIKCDPSIFGDNAINNDTVAMIRKDMFAFRDYLRSCGFAAYVVPPCDIEKMGNTKIFTVDVGSMPPLKSQEYLKSIMEDLKENEASFDTNYFFTKSADGKGSNMEIIPSYNTTITTRVVDDIEEIDF